MHDCDIDTHWIITLILEHEAMFAMITFLPTRKIQIFATSFFCRWNYVPTNLKLCLCNRFMSFLSLGSKLRALSVSAAAQRLFSVGTFVCFFFNIEISTNCLFCALALNATKNNTKGHERCKQSNGPFVGAGPLGSGPDRHENIIATVQS